MKQIKIEQRYCDRCGKGIACTIDGIGGKVRNEMGFHALCQDCITPEERHRINLRIGQSILETSQ